MAKESDDCMDNLGNQIMNLCGSLGRHLSVLSPNVPGMELWMSMTGICDSLQEVKQKIDHPVLTPHEAST